MKLLSGGQVRTTRSDTFETLGVGAKVFPAPWLSLSGYLPYRSNTGRYEPADRDVETSGIGDPALSASFDLLELLNPSMIPTRCPETGGWILAAEDEEDVIKAPHLTLTAGVAFPLGDDDLETHGWTYPPQYQPGAGTWVAGAGLYFSEGIGPVTPSLGASYLWVAGANDAGYEKPDSLVATAAANWLFWYGRRGRLYVGANLLVPLHPGRQDGQELAGSDMKLVALDVGLSFWILSLPATNKIIAGAMASFPLREGDAYTEPRAGTAWSFFMTYGF